jgi:hypothetical protein
MIISEGKEQANDCHVPSGKPFDGRKGGYVERRNQH